MDTGKPRYSPPASSVDHDPTADGGGSAVFRLLLPHSFSDADTMGLYVAVNLLRRRTTAVQVRVDPLDSSSAAEDAIRVAVILGPITPVRRIEASSSSGEPLTLSPVQEALIAVVDAEGALHRADVAGRGAPGSVTCLLLVEAARLEVAAGRGVLGRIALETGAGMRVVPWELGAPSPCRQQPEEVVEITGDRATVRKGLVALSSCLQGDQPAGSSTNSVKKGGSIPWTSSEMPDPSTGTFCSEASREHGESGVPLDCPQSVTTGVETKGLQQISFRLLCPIYIAGGLIGKKGSVIKGIEDETGACIDVSPPLSGCSERLITISALESPDSDYHMVQSALLHIFDRMQELESRTGSKFDQPFQSSARALVLKSQYACLIGLGGSIIKEMVNATGAKIQILDESDVPACGSQYERVLQISGEFMNVRDALCLVNWKLRNHVFSFMGNKNDNGCVPASNLAKSNATSQVNLSSTDQYSAESCQRVDYGPSLGYGMDPVEKSFSDFQLSSSEVQKAENDNGNGINNSDNGEWSDNGISKSTNCIASTGENNFVRGIKPARITRITYETVISGNILCHVYGDNGNNLIQLRETTGAEVSVYNPSSEGSEATIVVSGPPDNVQSAQYLLVDLILQQGQS